MSISPIYTSAYSTISINRGSYADRPFGGTTEESRSAKEKAPISAGDIPPLFGSQTVQRVNTKESVSKSQIYPEKSTDSGKKRSQSGDILDLSGQAKSQVVEKPAEKAESSVKVGDLTPEEQQQVEKLKARDAEVRNHEAAHLAAAGQHAQGGPKYVYQTGPDGRQYAIGGSVSIDVSPVSGDPQATLQKAQQVRSAALAPAEPSGQDQKVAAAASQMEADARLQLAREKVEKAEDDPEKSDTYGPFGSLNIESDKESDGDANKAALKSSQTPSFSSQRKPGTAGVASAYQNAQTHTSAKRAFIAYA